MNISGLTVCVDYAPLLARSLPLWQAGCDALVVVTSPGDQATQTLCADHRVTSYQTDAFWREGAQFNKAAAMVEALGCVRPHAALFAPGEAWFGAWQDWLLFFDADVVPPANWRALIRQAKPLVGNLYGARRLTEHGDRVPDGELGGFFQLFHADDPCAQRRPLLDTRWRHAGGYDSEFEFRWPPHLRRRIPGLDLVHHGEPGRNWCGVGNEAAMRALMHRRAAMPGMIPASERLPGGERE